jgi:hypothetical protein
LVRASACPHQINADSAKNNENRIDSSTSIAGRQFGLRVHNEYDIIAFTILHPIL